MAMDELTMLSFVGLYFLLLGSFIYNFYLSKRMYKLLGTIGEVVAVVAEKGSHDVKEKRKEDTMKKLIRKGMELQETNEDTASKRLLGEELKQEKKK